MASRFWVGGSGNWSDTAHWSTTSGGGGGSAVPTSSDDVTFDSGSGTAATVVVDVAANCNTLTVNKSDLTVRCDASMTIVGALTLTTGTYNANSQAQSWHSLTGTGSAGSRTLTLGSAAVTITTNGSISLTGGLTVTANTATITATNMGYNAAVNWNGTSFNITTSGGGVLAWSSGNSTFGNLTINSPSSDNRAGISFNQPITVTGVLTFNGYSAVSRLLVCSNVVGSSRTITVNGSHGSHQYVDFQDITIAGSAGTLTGTSIGDCLGNSGITFDGSATQTWQGTSGGNWDDPTKWTSRIPLPQDDVIIASAFSASQTISVNMARIGRSIDCSGATGNPAFSLAQNVVIFGGLILASGMTFGGTNRTLTVQSRSGTATSLVCNGAKLIGNVVISFSNTWTNFDVECTTARTVTLPANGTQTITGTLTLQGASGQVLSLVSATPGTPTTLLLKAGATLTRSFYSFSADVKLAIEIGQAAETDTANTSGKTKQTATGQTAETDTANAAGKAKAKTIRGGASPVLDDANRPDENPITNNGAWATTVYGGTTGLQVVSNKIQAAHSNAYGRWGTPMGADCRVGVTMDATGSEFLLFLRWTDSATPTGYVAYFYGGATGELDIWKVVSDTWTVLASPTDAVAGGYQAGDRFVFQATGTKLEVLRNGTLILAIDDATISGGGDVGLQISSTGVNFDDFLASDGVALELDYAQPDTRQAGHSVAVAQTGETDTANATTDTKKKTVGQPAETDTAQTAARTKTRTAAQTTETDTANQTTETIAHTVAQAEETDTPQPAAKTKQTAADQASETDTAQATARLKQKTSGQAVETDAATAAGRVKAMGVGNQGWGGPFGGTWGDPLVEADTAQPIIKLKAAAAAQVDETDAAETVTAHANHQIGQTVETDAATAAGRVKATVAGQTEETDTATATSKTKALNIQQTAETDTSTATGKTKTHPAAQTEETDAATSTGINKARTVPSAAETDGTFTILPHLASQLGIAVETDDANPASVTKAETAGQAAETNDAFATVVNREYALNRSDETDTSSAFDAAKNRPLLQALELAEAAAFASLKELAAGQAVETDDAHYIIVYPFRSGTTGNIDIAEDGTIDPILTGHLEEVLV